MRGTEYKLRKINTLLLVGPYSALTMRWTARLTERSTAATYGCFRGELSSDQLLAHQRVLAVLLQIVARNERDLVQNRRDNHCEKNDDKIFQSKLRVTIGIG